MNNICYYPWVGVEINPQGEFRPCCKYSNSLGNSLDEYKSNKELHQLQQDFLAGKKPKGCNRCWSEEDAGIPSKRIIDFKYTFKGTKPDLNSYKALSLPFGNVCNLACRTCNSAASSRWTQEEAKLQDQFKNIVIHKHQKFYKDSKFISDIKSISTDLIDIIFPGGESFITGVEQQLDYLDFLIQNNTAKNISLTYITNTTTMPVDEFWRKWTHFKKVNIQLSVDGVDDKFEYLRWPANWPQCYSNIKQYQTLQQQYNNIQLSVSHTVSIFNVYYLPEFWIWCLKEKLPEPYIGMVETPAHYNVKVLPQELKALIKKKLSAPIFDKVVNYMDDHIDGFDQTVEWIKALDTMRSQRVTDTFPILAEYTL